MICKKKINQLMKTKNDYLARITMSLLQLIQGVSRDKRFLNNQSYSQIQNNHYFIVVARKWQNIGTIKPMTCK